jgi:O-antigen ligase
MPIFAEPVASYAEKSDTLLFRRAQTWWTMLALLILADENSLFTVAQGQGKSLIKVRQFYDVSSPLLLLATGVMWAIVIALTVRRLRPTLRLLSAQKRTLCVVALAFASMAWSQDPETTIKKAVLLLLTCVFAWLFAVSYPPMDQLRILLVVGLVVAFASIAMAVALPQYGLDSGGEWKGILGQKNHLGHAVLFLFSGVLFRPVRGVHQFRLAILQGVLALFVIAMSHSAGSLILALLLVFLRFYGPFVKALSRGKVPFVLFGTLCAGLIIIFGRGAVLSVLGREPTLTGRTREWAVLAYYAIQHLWLGYGYQAFWNGTGDSLHAMEMVGGAMRGADSGYIDIVLQVGVFGLLLVAIAGFLAMRDSLLLFRRGFVPLAAYWYIGIVLATLIGSFTDAFFPLPGNIASFMFVLASAGLGILVRETQ